MNRSRSPVQSLSFSDKLFRFSVGNLAGVGEFRGDFFLCYRVNLESRLASRVLWQVGAGAYRNEQDVYELAYALEWPRWFRVDRTLRVDVAATRSPLTSLEFATLVTLTACAIAYAFWASTRGSPTSRSSGTDWRST